MQMHRIWHLLLLMTTFIDTLDVATNVRIKFTTSFVCGMYVPMIEMTPMGNHARCINTARMNSRWLCVFDHSYFCWWRHAKILQISRKYSDLCCSGHLFAINNDFVLCSIDVATKNQYLTPPLETLPALNYSINQPGLTDFFPRHFTFARLHPKQRVTEEMTLEMCYKSVFTYQMNRRCPP